MGALLKLIVLASLVWLVISFIRRLGSPAGPHRDEPAVTPMHPCRYCGVQVAEPDCTCWQGRYFCCTAHRDAWLKDQS